MTLTLADVAVLESPERPGWTRLVGRLHSDVDDVSESLWLDVPEGVAEGLQASSDAFVAWLAPLAATRRETLQLKAPVDALLLCRIREVLRIWRIWYPELEEVPIVAAETVSSDGPPAGRRTASMFTGGVDAFFTVLRHDAGAGTPVTVPIDDLLYVQGFDVPLQNTAALQHVQLSLQQAAAALGKRFITVATNLRETRFGTTDWPRLSHGAALAGVAHALSGVYATVLLGSSSGYHDLRSWGSHPLTDPLFSSSRLDIVHDGAAFRRVEKTAYVVQSPIARRHLRVCWRSSAGDNCGTCSKCLRSMLALEALGVLDACSSFDRAALDLERAVRIYCGHDFERRLLGHVRDLATQSNRHDLAAAIDASLSGSRRLAKQLAFVRGLRDRRVIWRWAPAWERWLLRGWVV